VTRIARVELGDYHGYEYEGDPARAAVVLPGAMLAGRRVRHRRAQ
jgi:hypothetical protein